MPVRDNDAGPAAAAGMRAVFLRRGPWGLIQSTAPGALLPGITIDSLAELPARLSSSPRSMPDEGGGAQSRSPVETRLGRGRRPGKNRQGV